MRLPFFSFAVSSRDIILEEKKYTDTRVCIKYLYSDYTCT